MPMQERGMNLSFRMKSRLCLLCALALGACAPTPLPQGQAASNLSGAAYPAFLTVGQMRAAAAHDPEADRTTEAGLDARAASLRARAERLRDETVVDPAARRKLDAAIVAD